MSVLYLVVPCYNEQEVLPNTLQRLGERLSEMIASGCVDEKSRVLFVDDGSRDRTWEILQEACTTDARFCACRLAHNRGHQNALLAGLMEAREHCDCAISLDADLQDDISVLEEFIARFQEGCDIVYGVRDDRSSDTVFKRGTAQMFYKGMKLLGAEIVYNHADYRLMSRRALDALSEYHEVNLFLRGIVPSIGFKTAEVKYSRHKREAGESKYPLKRMLSLAVDGVTSFSVKPLKMISRLGIFISCLSVLGLVYALVSYFTGHAVPGWTAIVCSIWLLGGIQLLCVGVLGSYIGRIFSEVKARPRYLIAERIGGKDQHT